ncbi:MAG: amidohydrolase family protein, partial [Chloroflexi bacterium]|nr:amidohydrolase family protein [Chloroflexota bacterium]
MSHADAASIKPKLTHPILDGDGHWVESTPVIVDYLRALGGAQMADNYLKSQQGRGGWYRASWEERRNKRLSRGNWWITVGNTLDFASAMLPGLLAERMDDMGIDFAVLYPTRCLGANSIQEPELRQAMCRAYNKMAADVFAPYKTRMTPAAMIPCYSPEEAIAELEYARGTLGLKACSFKGSLQRPIPAYAKDGDGGRVPYYIDALGLDNPT